MRDRSRMTVILGGIGLTLMAMTIGLAARASAAAPPLAPPNPAPVALNGHDAAGVAGSQQDVTTSGRAAPKVRPLPSATCGPTWRSEPSLPSARAYSALVESGGSLYIVSGFTGSTYDPSVLRFDPTPGTWTAVAPIPTPISQARAAALDGKIYVAGGYNLGQITNMQIYTITTNTWGQGAPLPEARAGAGVVALNGKIYVVAGFGPGFAERSTLWEYDPVLNTYAVKAPVPAAGGNVNAGVLNGHIYAVGGSNSYLHYAYDPGTDSWAPIAAGLTANFQTPGVFALDGELYVEGGSNGFVGYPPEQEVQIYTPGSDSWRFGPPMLTPRFGASAAAALAGRGYVAAGADYFTGAYLTAVESVANVPCVTPTATPTQPATATPTATQAPTHTPTPCAIHFTDVQPSDWFYEYVRYLYCRGAISGYADGTFRPFNNTTRGQLSKIVVLGFALPINTAGGPHFTDVAVGSTFYDYVETAYNASLISGYADGTFRPNNNVTRGQLSKIIVQAGVLVNGWTLLNPATPTFTDVPPGSAFYQYVETAYCHQIISGYSDGTFRPGNDATRAQIAKIASLAIQNTGVCAP